MGRYRDTWSDLAGQGKRLHVSSVLTMKTLVFAEKPSVGRDIARVLGANHRGEGFLENDKWIITWGIGHLITLGEPGVQNPSWKAWSLAGLPMIPQSWKLVVLPNTSGQFSVVKELMNRPDVTSVVNAADAGREGELIFRLVYRMAGCTKPLRRLWISSMTDEAIKKGFAALKPGQEYDRLAAAAECRMQSDWLVGLNFTRCYTKKLDTMLTLGRVQTPTLGLIVRRYQEIHDFKPVSYWEVLADLGDFKALWYNPSEKELPSRIGDEKRAREISQTLQGAQAEIKKVLVSKKTQPPPFLYDLTTLQREANSRYGLTAAQTLAAAQSLYEQRKAITYPRTDSRYLSRDLHATLKDRLKSLPQIWDEWRNPLLGKALPIAKRVFDDKQVSDHHAIIPTEKAVRDISSWKPEEKQIYDLVARRFLAVFLPDHEFLSTTVFIQSRQQNLKAVGRTVLNPGWRAIYGKESAEPEDKDDEQSLPPLKEHDLRQIVGVETLTKQTKPPAQYTESTLLQAMETAGKLVEDDELRLAMKDSGLGTPATRAEIIEKLIRVGYIVRDKKKILPTPKGIQLITIVDSRLKSPELTGTWEKRLADISKGNGEEKAFMADICRFIQDLVASVKSASYAAMPPEPGRNAGAGRPGNRIPREKPPASPGNKPSPGAVMRTPPAGIPPVSKPTAATAVPIQDRPSFGTCPACGKGRIIEGERGFGCDRFREGCSYVVWKSFMGKKLSETAVKSLILGKATRVMKGFKRPDGQEVSGRIRMREDRKGIEFLEQSVRGDEKE